MRRISGLEPSLGWSFLSRDALARAKAQMDEESTGVRDEIGFLTIHQSYADRFFPGTSVLHTRARYAIIVPWLFEDLAGLTGASATRALRDRECELAGRLTGLGVIGRRVFPKPSSQPPSTVYWNAMAVWGILRPRPNGRTISRAQAHRLLRPIGSTTDDDGQPLFGFDPPFVALPRRPGNWQDGDISLDLARDEATFLRERLSDLRRPSDPELCLLARLVRTGAEAPADMWSPEVMDIAGPDRSALRRAQQAASLAGIGRAIYDALLESMFEREDKRPISTRHRDHLVDIVDQHGAIARKLDIDALEADIGNLHTKLRAVLFATKLWIEDRSLDPRALFEPYEAAEARKGTRARLARTPNGRARRLEWSSDEHGLATSLHYRWEQVATLLDDLAAAL